jgi:hypothetical protein
MINIQNNLIIKDNGKNKLKQCSLLMMMNKIMQLEKNQLIVKIVL